jgi:uncharacterized protein YchJ
MKKLITIFTLFCIFLAACANDGEPVIEADKPPVHGNLAGNINNWGFAAIQGDWIYFNQYGDNGGLYKTHIDGTQKIRLNENIHQYINVVGDWVYYYYQEFDENGHSVHGVSGIYRIRTDGTEKTKLLSGYTPDMHVVGDWIYFRLGTELHKMRVDGTEQTQLKEFALLFPSINIVDDWIYLYHEIYDDYFISIFESESLAQGIFKIRTDGTELTQIIEEVVSYINVTDEWIYYSNHNDKYIYKIRIDGTERTQLNSERSILLVVDNGWIYYLEDENNYICRIRIDGTDRTELNSDRSAFFAVVGDWIYYHNMDDRANIYRMKTDGSQRQLED